jgi:hypothetical protein
MNNFVKKQILEGLDPNLDAQNVCDEDELVCLKKFQRTHMIRDFACFPVHPRAIKQYRIQKVLVDDFDLVKYIKNICDYISGTYLIAMDLGYFVMKPTDHDETIR